MNTVPQLKTVCSRIELEHMAEIMQTKVYSHNQVVAKEGSCFHRLAVVMQGGARILKRYRYRHDQSADTAWAVGIVEVSSIV